MKRILIALMTFVLLTCLPVLPGFLEEGIGGVALAYDENGFEYDKDHPTWLVDYNYPGTLEEGQTYSVTIPDGVTRLCDGSFTWDRNLSSVTIPASVEVIDGGAFYCCGKLRTVNLAPAGLKEIGKEAFMACPKLDSINLPEGLETLGYRAFASCESLKSVHIPSTLVSIDQAVFQSCGLEEVIVPGTIEVIPDGMFQNCKNLAHATLEKGVREIGVDAFSHTALKGAYRGKASNGIELPDGLEKIGSGAFMECPFETLDLPDSVTELDEKCIYTPYKTDYPCPTMKSVHWPAGVKDVPAFRFRGFSALEQIEIPEGVKTIGKSAFNDCSALTSLSLPGTLNIIGEYAFFNCDSLETVTVRGNQLTIGSSVFSSCEKLNRVTLDPGVVAIGDYAFSYCSMLTYVNLPEGLMTIGGYAFFHSPIEELLLPDSVTSLAETAFHGLSEMQSLKRVRWTAGIPEVPSNEFAQHTALETIILPEGVTGIGGDAFRNTGIKAINLPESLETLGGYAFYGCTALPEIALPDSLTGIGSDAFPKANELLIVNCTSYARTWAQENRYPADAGQAGYRYLAIHTGETETDAPVYPTETEPGVTPRVHCLDCGDVVSGGAAVPPLSELSLLKLPENLRSIEAEAFMGGAFEGVIIPDGCRSIGARAFAGCDKLVYIFIPASVTTIAEDAFEGCGDMIVAR